MSDIHVRITEDGIRLWRTVRSTNGTRVRVVGASVQVAGKGELNVELPIFHPKGGYLDESGGSNDNRSGD